MNCGSFTAPYSPREAGILWTPKQQTVASTNCSIGQTDVYLDFLNIQYDDRWRNFGILWAYTAFNAIATVGVYWLARVPKGSKKEEGVKVVKAEQTRAEGL